MSRLLAWFRDTRLAAVALVAFMVACWGVMFYLDIRVDPPDVLGRECMSHWATLDGELATTFGWAADCDEAEGDYFDRNGRYLVLVYRRVLTRSEVMYSSDLWHGPDYERMK
jgi:hypothetical protein